MDVREQNLYGTDELTLILLLRQITFSTNYNLPCLKLIVVNTIPIPEDEKVVLLVALACFVFHIPVVLPGYLVFIAEKHKTNCILIIGARFLQRQRG